jgi:hypothetical protein
MQLAPRPDNYANQFHTYDLDVGKKVIAKLIKNRLNNLSETNSHIEKLKNRNIDKELKNLKNLDTFVRNFFPVLIYYNFDQISEIYNDMKIKSNWSVSMYSMILMSDQVIKLYKLYLWMNHLQIIYI